MQYVVLFTQRFTFTTRDDETKTHTTCQRINCRSKAEATAVSDALNGIRGTQNYSEVAIKVWSGKDWITLPISTLEHIVSELTEPELLEAAE